MHGLQVPISKVTTTFVNPKAPTRAKASSSVRCARAAEDSCQVFICTNKACRKAGSLQVVEFFKNLAPPNAEIVTTGCLGKCGNGPNLIITPDELHISHCNTATHIARLLEKQCGATDADTNLKAFELNAKGSEAFSRADHAAAEAYFTEAIELKPSGGLHIIYCSRSACRAALGDPEGALADVDEAEKLKPHWSTAMIRRAQAYEAKGERATALQLFRQTAEVDAEFRKSKLFLRKCKELQLHLEGAAA